MVESSLGQMSSTGISGYTREKKITSAKSAKRYVLENYAKVGVVLQQQSFMALSRVRYVVLTMYRGY